LSRAADAAPLADVTSSAVASSAGATAFTRATAVRALGDGRYAAAVDAGWEAPTGPNGGYLAAIVVRALEAEAAPDGERRLRSLTVHYLRTARTGPLELEVRVVRAGRRLAQASVTARQEGREVLLALAAFAVPGLDAAATWSGVAPDVGPPPAAGAPSLPVGRYRADAGAWVEPAPGMPTITRQLRLSPRIGGLPFAGRVPEGGAAVETGGWIASPEAQPIDAAYVAQLTDFWWPPAFAALDRPAMAPTVDLTIHFRADVPAAGLEPAPVLGHYRSTTAVGGLVEEDGTLYLPDGTLLAQSRQLALLAPLP
jgi:acyl-CoA thioesterase